MSKTAILVEEPETPVFYVADAAINVNRYILVGIALLCVMIHGNYMYNSVGFVVWWSGDPILKKESLEHIGLFTRSTAYYSSADMLIGAALSNVLDIIGPKYFTIIGHVLATIGWSMYQLPMKYAYIWLPLSCTLQGASIQAFTNSSLMLGKMFKRNRNLVMAVLGSCVDFSLFLPLVFERLRPYMSTQQVAIMMIILLVFTGLLVVFTYPNGVRALGTKTFSMKRLEEQAREHPDITLYKVMTTWHFFGVSAFYTIVLLVFQIETAFMANVISMLPTESVLAISDYFSYSTFLGVVSCILVGRMAEFYTITVVIAIYAVLGPITSICLYMMTTKSVIIGIILYNMYKSSIFTMLFAYCAEFFPCRYTARCASFPTVLGALAFFPLLEYSQRALKESIHEHGQYIGTRIVLEWVLRYCIVAGFLSALIYVVILKKQKVSDQTFHHRPLEDVYMAAR